MLAVIVGADSLRLPRSGVGRMTLEIVRAMQRHPAVGSLHLLIHGHIVSPGPVLASLDATPAPPSRLTALKRRFAHVPGVQPLRTAKIRLQNRRILATLREQSSGRVIYHEPNMIAQPLPVTTVCTVNDLSWHAEPAWHPAERLAWIARNLPRSLAQAARFVAISEFTRAAMVADLGLERDRIDVVPLAAGPEFRTFAAAEAAPALERHRLEDRAYVLGVSTLEPRKNFDRLVHAHTLLPEALRRARPLVIVGGSGWGDRLASAPAEAARREGTVRLLGHVPDADLTPLYARAACFAYPSLYEGFGLPVLEAMAAGTAVIAAATTATGETAGDAALLVDPLDPAAIAAALEAALTDPALATRLAAAGLARAATFSWTRTADALVASWQRALG